jgi:molecular chaperone DnaJ
MVWIGMEKPKDYYQLLGVPRDASLAAIRRAYKRLARKEPDRAENDHAELRAAYETLSDAERRRRYDDQLATPDRNASALEWSFARRPVSQDLRRPLAPTSLTAEIVLRAEEAAAGTVLSLDVPVTATCEACSGTGGALFDCEHCGGEGRAIRRLPVPVHVPAGVREGSVFQVRTDQPAVPSILLTVHLRRI